MITINPKAFFFDFDGVIVDSEKIHMLAALEAVVKHGISFSEHYYFAELLGYDDIGMFNHLWNTEGKKLDCGDLRQLMREKHAAFMRLMASKIVFFDGVVEFVLELAQNNIPMAVVSGAIQSEITACLDNGGLAKYFKFIVSADQVTRSKPSAECYEKAWSDMLDYVPDLDKHDCWAIEDSPAGISAAIDAGINVIGITNSVKADQLARADHVIGHIGEIRL